MTARLRPSRAPACDRLARVLARFVLAAGAALAAAPASAQPAAERVAPNPPLPTVGIQAGMHLITAEVAADGPTRARGLMMREKLAPNAGMLFVFQDKAGQCFWMKNTLIPLSIAFIEDDGTIVNIRDMQPLSEESHCSARPVRYALEMEQGWFARRGIGPGVRLRSERVFSPSRN